MLSSTRFVTPDAGGLIAALFNETNTARAIPLIRAIERSEVDAVAPSLLVTEFLEKCAWIRSGGRPYSNQAIDEIVKTFLNLPILYIPNETIASEAWRLHRPGGVELPDAFYLTVAMQWGAELWTADRGLFSQALPVYNAVFNLNTVSFA